MTYFTSSLGTTTVGMDAAEQSQAILTSLPLYLQLAFPAVLSQKGGLLCNVLTQLQVSNQHKMGPQGVHSLLLEMHTLCYSRLLLQYLEAIFEQARSLKTSEVAQTTLH